MTNLLNIKDILNETLDYSNICAKESLVGSYLSSITSSLSKLNETYTNSSKILYKSVLEAESKEEENSKFCDYYKEYSSAINEIINQVNNMNSKFTISIDNLIDANLDLIKDPDLCNQNINFNFDVYKFDNLEQSKYPKFQPLAIYHKDFDIIGQMMQDLGPIASQEAKLQIIATVCNNISKCNKNKWLEKTIEDIIDEDDCKDLACYSKEVYKLFRKDEPESVDINKGYLYSVKNTLSNYSVYKDTINNIVSSLTTEFSAIADNIKSMCFRNDDKVLKIRSKSSEIRDNDYQLDTYGMSQLNIFMKAKISQINQLCSLYLIALSVKMDAIVEYLTQCIDILKAAKDVLSGHEVEKEKEAEIDNEYDEDLDSDDTPSPDDFDDHEDFEDDDSEDDDLEEPETEDIPTEDEPPSEEPKPEEQTLSSEEEPKDDNTGEIAPDEPDEDKEVINGGKVENAKIHDFKEGYFFDGAIYAIESMYEMDELNTYVESVLFEAEGDTPNAEKGLGTLSSGANVAERAWSIIVEKVKEAFRKFTSVFYGYNKKKVELISKYQNSLKDSNKVKGDGLSVFEAKTNNLMIPIPEFNYASMKENLSDQEKFAASVNGLKEFTSEDGGFVEVFEKKTILLDSKKDANSYRDIMVKYIVEDSSKVYALIEKEIKLLDNAKAKARTISKQLSESTNTFNDYFNEMEEDKETTSKIEKENKGSNPSVGLKTYFTACSRFVSKKMSCSQKIFNEYYSCLHRMLQISGVLKSGEDKAKNDNTKENK